MVPFSRAPKPVSRRRLNGGVVLATCPLLRGEIQLEKINEELALIAKSSKHENAKQPHWAQARSSCWGTRSPPL